MHIGLGLSNDDGSVAGAIPVDVNLLLHDRRETERDIIAGWPEDVPAMLEPSPLAGERDKKRFAWWQTSKPDLRGHATTLQVCERFGGRTIDSELNFLMACSLLERGLEWDVDRHTLRPKVRGEQWALTERGRIMRRLLREHGYGTANGAVDHASPASVRIARDTLHQTDASVLPDGGRDDGEASRPGLGDRARSGAEPPAGGDDEDWGGNAAIAGGSVGVVGAGVGAGGSGINPASSNSGGGDATHARGTAKSALSGVDVTTRKPSPSGRKA